MTTALATTKKDAKGPNRINRVLDRMKSSASGHDVSHELSIPIATQILLDTPFKDIVVDGCESKRQVAQTYADSHEMLGQTQHEMLRFLLSTIVSNSITRFEGSVRHGFAMETALTEMHEKMLKRFPFRLESFPNELTTRNVEKPLDAMHRTLQDSIATNATKLADRFFQALTQMAAENWIGRIEWVGATSCNLYFFQHVVVQGDTEQQQIEQPTGATSNQNAIVGQNVVRTVTTGTHTFRHGFHYYEVMDAQRREIPTPDYPLPPRVQLLVEHVPHCLRPFIQHVDGHQIREMIVERDIETRSWEDVRDELIVERPVYAYDPAITLFDYVLTGWTKAEDDEAREKARENERTPASFGNKIVRFFTG